MSRSPRDGSLSAVAKAAGVSLMTVSRVMRDAPHVAEPVRARVLRAARKAGYRPNPLLGRLMAIVRDCRQRRMRATLGVIRDDLPGDELHDSAYQYVATSDIGARAERHGYTVEEFHLGRGGMTPQRLVSILRARGIEGLIVSPQSTRDYGSQIDFSRFAAVTFGYGLRAPQLHRASTNMMQGILDTAAILTARGYRRIGLAVPVWVDARSNHTYSGALLHFQLNLAPRQRVPPLLLPDKLDTGADLFCRWQRRHRPDVLISLDAYVPEWLTRRLGLRIPEDIGLVVHDWTERMAGCAGIDHRRPHTAAAAVDLVATQLMHNEFGVPDVPRQILIPARWVEGQSVRPPPRRGAGR